MMELQLLKSITRRRQERQDMEIQFFLKKKNQSRKRLLQDMDEELDVAQALGLCAVAMKRPRKGRSVDEERSSSFLATPSNSSWPPSCLSAKPRFQD